MTQLPLIEPTGGELIPMCLQHLKRARKYESQAVIAKARGLETAAFLLEGFAAQEYEQADELEMLATFEALGKVHA